MTAIEVDGVVQTVGYPFTLANVTVKTAVRFTIAPGVITVSPGKDCATNAAVVRTGRFLPDLAIYTGSALPSDYTHSGFDRGHLEPAVDMRFDALAMIESFSKANTSPQFPAFNRGVWKRLEEHVRTLAVRRRSCVVVTGLIFYTNTSPRDRRKSRPRPRCLLQGSVRRDGAAVHVAFILPHESTQATFCAFVTNVDAVVEMTGLDIFSEWTVENQDAFESVVD